MFEGEDHLDHPKEASLLKDAISFIYIVSNRSTWVEALVL